MQVYIEDALLDTTVINFVILYLTVFSLKQKIVLVRLILSALLGSIFSLLLTLVSMSLFITLSLKLISGLIMVAISINFFDFKTFFLSFLVFASFTFLIGGFCFFIIYLLGGEVYSIATMSYNLPISLGLITLLIGLYVLFLIKIIKVFYKRQKLNNFYYDLYLSVNNKTKKIKAYLDTGNLLQDPNTGQPILVLGLNRFLDIYKDKVNIIDCLNGRLHLKIKGRYIKFNSAASYNQMFVFKPKSVEVAQKNNQKKVISVLVGVGCNNFNKNDFDALLSPLAL